MRHLLRASLVVLSLVVIACGGGMNTPVDAGSSPVGNVMGGLTVYINNSCGGCHGTDGAGTTSGPTITGNMMAGIGGWTQVEFNKALRERIGKDGVMFCASMQAYPRLTDQQLADLLAFLKSKDSATVQRGPPSCQ